MNTAALIAIFMAGSRPPSLEGPKLIPETGHTEAIYSLAVEPARADGAPARLLTVSKDNTMRLWDLQTGEEVDALHGPSNKRHKRSVFFGGYTRQGDIVTASEDRRALLWPRSGDSPITLHMQAIVYAVAIGEKTDVLVIATAAGIRAYDPTTREDNTPSAEMGILPDADSVLGLCLSDDERTAFVLCQRGGRLDVRSMPIQSRPKDTPVGAPIDVSDAAMSPLKASAGDLIDCHGDKLAIAAGSRLVLRNRETGQDTVTEFAGETIAAVKFDASGRLALATTTLADETNRQFTKIRISGAGSDWALLWPKSATPEAGGTNAIAFTPDGGTLIFTVRDKAYAVDTKAGQGSSPIKFEGHGGRISAVGLALRPGSGGGGPTGRLMVRASSMNVRVWNFPGGASREFQPAKGSIMAAAMSPDGHWLAISYRAQSPRIDVHDLDSGERPRRIELASRSDNLFFTKDSQNLYFVCGDKGQPTTVWKSNLTRQEPPVGLLTIREDTNAEMAIDPDGTKLLVGGANGKLTIYDFASKSGRVVPVEWRSRRIDDISCVQFSPDGKRFLAATKANLGLLLPVEHGTKGEGRAPVWLPQGSGDIRAAAFDAAGKYVFVGDQNHDVGRIDTSTREKLTYSHGHLSWVDAMATASLDGKTFVLTGANDGTAALWNDSGERLCRIVSLENDEWAVIDEDHRYDASYGGDVKGLHWVHAGKTYTLQQAKQGFYEDQLLSKLLGFNAEKLREVARDWRPAPRSVQLSMDQDEIVVTVGRDAGYKPGKVELYVDNILAEDAMKSEPGGGNSSRYVIGLEHENIRRRRAHSDKVELHVKAYNEDGTLFTTGKPITLPALGVDNGDVELYALAIGVSEEAGGIRPLLYPSIGAERFSQALRNVAGAALSPERIHIKLLQTPTTNLAEAATRENFLKAMKDIRTKADANDTFILYMAGHGSSEHGEYRFLTQKTKGANGKFYVTAEDIRTEFDRLLVRKRALVVATCGAGGIQRELDKLSDKSGFVSVAACGKNELSFETYRLEGDLLTFALLDYLNGPAKDNPGSFEVDVNEWFAYAEAKAGQIAAVTEVKQYAARPRASQRSGKRFVIGVAKRERFGSYVVNPRSAPFITIEEIRISSPQIDRPALEQELWRQLLSTDNRAFVVIRNSKDFGTAQPYRMNADYSVSNGQHEFKVNLANGGQPFEGRAVERDLPSAARAIARWANQTLSDRRPVAHVRLGEIN